MFAVGVGALGGVGVEVGLAVRNLQFEIGELGLDHVAHLAVDCQLVHLPPACWLLHRPSLPAADRLGFTPDGVIDLERLATGYGPSGRPGRLGSRSTDAGGTAGLIGIAVPHRGWSQVPEAGSRSGRRVGMRWTSGDAQPGPHQRFDEPEYGQETPA